MRMIGTLAIFLILAGGVAWAGEDPAPPSDLARQVRDLQSQIAELKDQLQMLAKATDDMLWFQRLGDVADIDKITYTGPPNPKGEETYGIRNERHPLKVFAYVFVPRDLDRSRRHPLIILPHGGVHADFTTYHAHIIRELMAQRYVVLAPEYRGSTGYGQSFYKAIDYGGLEVDDCVAGRDWAVDNLPFIDPGRVAMAGWSHGGLISLLAVCRFPEKFAACYAGVPVSDLLARMGYTDDEYRADFAAPYHLGKTANQDVDEYRRRSPVWNMEKLKTPLLVHTTTNDRDVNVVEVEHLVQALKAAGKEFEYKIYPDAPGGHSFNRIDTALARESRQEIYRFLARHLKPAEPR